MLHVFLYFGKDCGGLGGEGLLYVDLPTSSSVLVQHT